MVSEKGDFGVDGVNGDNVRSILNDFLTGVNSGNSSSLSILCKFLVDVGDLGGEWSSGEDKRYRCVGGELVGVVEELKVTAIWSCSLELESDVFLVNRIEATGDVGDNSVCIGE